MSVEVWTRKAFVSITPDGTSDDLNYSIATETMRLEFGEKGVDYVVNLIGGRMRVPLPEEPASLTLELHPRTLADEWGASVTADGGLDLIWGESGASSGALLSDIRRKQLRVVLLWTDDSTVTTALSDVDQGKKAVRLQLVDGYATKSDIDFTDGKLKLTLAFSFAPYTRDGNKCYKVEYRKGDEASGLSAITGTYSAGDGLS